ncbi:hypothetical protein Bca101_022739 [Brassica carinata]
MGGGLGIRLERENHELLTPAAPLPQRRSMAASRSGCWTIVSSELVSALRFIRGDDTVYTEYSSQFLMDYACPAKASLKNQKNGHYCYKYSPLKAMDFMITDGLPREEHWPYQGCRKASPPVYTPPPPEYPHVYIASRKSLRTLEEAMEKLASHPIGAGLAIFTPDYQMIKGGIYRGPMYRESKFEELHAVSLYRVGMEEGEAIGYVKSTHGELIGEKGCLKVSLEVLMVEVPQEGREADDEFKKPKRLLSRFFYPELPPREVGV